MLGLRRRHAAAATRDRSRERRSCVSNDGRVLIPLVGICFLTGYLLVGMVVKRYQRRAEPLHRGDELTVEDCREILNVSWRASESDIEMAYRQLRSIYEPKNFGHLDAE